MLNEFKKSKLERFANDKDMLDAVYDVLLEVFIKPKPNADVHEKASRFISIENLQEAWREIEKYRSDNKIEEKARVNNGV